MAVERQVSSLRDRVHSLLAMSADLENRGMAGALTSKEDLQLRTVDSSLSDLESHLGALDAIELQRRLEEVSAGLDFFFFPQLLFNGWPIPAFLLF